MLVFGQQHERHNHLNCMLHMLDESGIHNSQVRYYFIYHFIYNVDKFSIGIQVLNLGPYPFHFTKAECLFLQITFSILNLF